MIIDTKKAVSVFVGLVTGLAMSGAAAVMPLVAQADTTSDLQAQISALLAQIQTLQSQLSVSGGTTTGTGYQFTTLMKVGSRGTEVTNLQKALGVTPTTGYFGSKTKAAVVAFQASKGLGADGVVGAKTRAALNALGGGTGGVVVPTGGGVAVSTPAQPSASLAVESAARVPFTKVTLTAGSSDVTVNGIKVERTGLAQDAVFAGVVLLDENGAQVGIAKTFNSLHQATVGETMVLRAGQSKTFTIAGNMASVLDTYAGQVAYLSVNGVDTTATVSGTFPVTGAGHTINASLTIGSVTNARGPMDPNGIQNKEVGTTGYIFSSVKFTAGSVEKIRIKSIRWNQSGSAAASDFGNIKTYVDGTAYDTTVSADGKYYTANFGSGIVVDKGNSAELYVKADIINGSGRTIAFDLYKNTDVEIVGETFGYGITPPTSGTGFASTNPWYDASVVTVTGGSATSISKSATVAAQNVAISVSEQPLGAFEAEIKGEPLTVTQSVFHFLVTGTGGQVADLTNISLYNENGAIIAGPVDGVGANTGGTATFTDTITYPTGKHVYSLKGKLGTDFVQNQTIAASTTPSSDWTGVTGQTTGNTITLTNGQVTMNTMTVKAATTTVTVASDPASQNVVMGITGFTFANYQFNASASGEDVKVNSVQFRYTDGGSDPTNCFAYDGATKLNSNAVNPSSTGAKTFTFDTALVVTKGTTKTVALKCDIPSNLVADQQIIWGINSADTMTGQGLVSGQSITLSHNTANSGTITLKSGGTLTITKDTDSPAYALVPSNTSGVTLGVLKFKATNEAVTITEIPLQLTNTSSSTAGDLISVDLYDGSTLLGSGTFAGSATTTLMTLSTPLVVPTGDGKLVTIKGTTGVIDENTVDTREGAFVAVDFDGDDQAGAFRATGNSSSAAVTTASVDTAMNGVRVFRTIPTVVDTTTATTLAAGADLYTFNVTADTKGAVQLYRVSFSVSTSTVTAVKDYFLYGPSGKVNATAAQVVGATGAQTLVVTFDATAADRVIGAGTTKTYRLQADTVTLATGTNSVALKLLGDAAYPALGTRMGNVTQVTADTAASDFVWSPNATTTAVAGDIDWTNGYGVKYGTTGTATLTTDGASHTFQIVK